MSHDDDDKELVDIREQMFAAMEGNPLYKRLLGQLKEHDAERIRNTVNGYLNDFARRFLDPIANQVNNDEFRQAFNEQLVKRNVKSEGSDGR